MDLELLPYSKFKILFINVFLILYKAATLNVHKLQADLREIRSILYNSNDVPFLQELFVLFISMQLMAKFILGYISLAANVIAIFPILSDDQPELLLPTMMSQAVENIVLNLLELLLGYVAVKYFVPGKMSIFFIFSMKIMIKITFSITTLNVYSELYKKLQLPVIYHKEPLMEDISKTECFIQKVSLAYQHDVAPIDNSEA